MTPCYYHPTQIVFLDDDINFLNLLVQNLPKNKNFYRLFDNPLTAADFINKPEACQANRFVQSNYSDHSLKNFCINLNLSDTYKESLNEDRFNVISTIVVDYKMPQMNGLDFLRLVKSENIKKILLTGEADEGIAIQAFNEGLIDHYIKKQTANVDQQLADFIQRTTYKFFESLSEPLIKHIQSIVDFPIAITSPEFESYFKKILQEYHINEFYILDAVGSYILIDIEGKKYNLFTQNEDIAKGFFLEIQDLDETLFPEKLKAKIKKGEFIFCCPENQEPLPDQEEWKNYCYPSLPMNTKDKKFFTAIIRAFQKS